VPLLLESCAMHEMVEDQAVHLFKGGEGKFLQMFEIHGCVVIIISRCKFEHAVASCGW